MRLQQKWHALHGCGVRTFAALSEALADQGCGIREPRNLPAVFAFAAKIIMNSFAVGRLREHASEREFSNSSRPGEKHCMCNAIRCQHAAQCGDDASIANEFRKAHSVAYLPQPNLFA
jgi:hypothetical protein